jgi:hypothetical protein
MKNKILFLAIVLGFSISTTMAQGFKLGIKGGADIHKLDGKAFKDEFSYGYHVGGFAVVNLTHKWGIQPEVLLSQVNIDTSSTFSDVYDFNSVSKVNLQYLKIPILLNYSPNPFVTLQVGPQYSILMDKNETLLKNGKNAFSNGDFSMIGGLQLNISKLRIYGRYGVGLNNINDIDDQDKWKNQNIQIGIGLNIL